MSSENLLRGIREVAEAVGLALGVASLAGLFGAAVDAFNQMEAAKSFSRDYEILTIRYDIRLATSLQWGTAVGLSSGSKPTRHPRLDHEFLRPLLERALNCIRMLLTDADGLRDNYGLQQVRAEDEQDEPDAIALLEALLLRYYLYRDASLSSRLHRGVHLPHGGRTCTGQGDARGYSSYLAHPA